MAAFLAARNQVAQQAATFGGEGGRSYASVCKNLRLFSGGGSLLSPLEVSTLVFAAKTRQKQRVRWFHADRCGTALHKDLTRKFP
jgi:hypothetical protein